MIKFTKIIVPAIASILIFGYTAANDCNMVKPYMNGNFDALNDWGYESILPQDAVGQAMINLKNFCCAQKVFSGDTCNQDSTIDPSLNFPSSTYLYDHILDISIRRLDAKISNNNGEDLIYGLDPDKTGEEWREFITQHANSKDGSVPLKISEEFKKNWEADHHKLAEWKNNMDKNDLRDLWKDDLDEYSNWNLVNKYMGVCDTSLYIYLNLPGQKDIDKLYTAYRNCKVLANNRVKKEVDYTKAILMQKGNKLLYSNIKTYLDNYFSQNKLISLQQLVFNIKNTFNEVNKAVIELVRNCS